MENFENWEGQRKRGFGYLRNIQSGIGSELFRRSCSGLELFCSLQSLKVVESGEWDNYRVQTVIQLMQQMELFPLSLCGD